MNRASEAAALAGVACNPGMSTALRLVAADKALDFYIDQIDKIEMLVEDWRGRVSSDNPSEYLDMSEMVGQITSLLAPS